MFKLPYVSAKVSHILSIIFLTLPFPLMFQHCGLKTDVAHLSSEDSKNSPLFSTGLISISECSEGFHSENGTCISDHKVCTLNGNLGSKGWLNGSWSSCTVCKGGTTSYSGQCFDNWIVAEAYASELNNCWQDGTWVCLNQKIKGYIGTPDKYAITSATSAQFIIRYTGASSVSLTPDLILLSGTGTKGCVKSVSNGSSASEKIVTISKCSGTGNLRIRIQSGSATQSSGVVLGSFGPSPDIMVINNSGFSNIQTSSMVSNYLGANGSPIPFELIYPSDWQNRTNIPVIIHIHGGAWSAGSYSEDSKLAQAIASLGFIVINTNYTLAPKSPTNYPVLSLPNIAYIGPDDITALVRYVTSKLVDIHADPTKVSIMGGSAGGHLASLEATRSSSTDIKFKCLLELAGPSDLKYAANNSNYPYTAWIIKSVFGNNSNYLNSKSPAKSSSLRASKVAIFHQIRDNIVPIEHALQFSHSLKNKLSSSNLFNVYGREKNNFVGETQMLPFKDSSRVTHLFSDFEMAQNAIKSFLQTQCK